MNKGYVYTLEVLIALSLILVTIFLAMKTPPTKPESEISLIKRTGFETLDFLTTRNRLREWVDADNESVIEGELLALLPKNVLAEVQLCTSPCDDSNVPRNQTVIGVDYYVAGYKDKYIGKEVKVWLWRKF
ncbi:MAG: hypothetical protein HYY37_03245 [Candidatus Aenigmarchaeota archaeon]|nr:hypothetical protein [Candidatus Aenigmarchaeota archaeon]